ncbi:MAG TPA: hypothetical protein VGN12_24305 [Pirellulales bacterium]|jgi:hypothetical protein
MSATAPRRVYGIALAILLLCGTSQVTADEPESPKAIEAAKEITIDRNALGSAGSHAVITAESDAGAAAAIAKALKQPVDLEFVDAPLVDVAEHCGKKFNINIRLDQKGLTDAAVDSSAPVTFSTLKPVSFESALRTILEEFDLAFVVMNEALAITSKEKADEILVTKVYYVGDLARARREATSSFGALMNLITSTIQPDSWEDNGGPGSIQAFNRDYLVFSQKQEVHDETAQLFEKLREELKAHSHAVNPEKPELFTRLYSVGAAPGGQMADAIKKLIGPASWKDQGGDGEICIVDRRGPAPPQIQGQPAPPTGDVLLIRQSPEVHDQIVEIMTSLNPFGGPRQFGGVIGGGMGGGSGNVGGGIGVGVGGGMFRVPNHSQQPKFK